MFLCALVLHSTPLMNTLAMQVDTSKCPKRSRMCKTQINAHARAHHTKTHSADKQQTPLTLIRKQSRLNPQYSTALNPANID